MKKKLSTRFPASRIKKIMQADEDVGKIALAVPVLVSKALELFLQDLCDRTYEITLQRGAKTMSSSHLKHCVETYSSFDFLRESMKKVPDIGGSDPRCIERNATRRRRIPNDEDFDTSEGKRSKTGMMMHHPGRRGRGRGRGRGRSAPSCRLNEERPQRHDDDLVTSSEHCDEQDDEVEKLEDRSEEKESAGCTNSKTATESFTESKGPNVEEAAKVDAIANHNNEYLVWADLDKMGIETSRFLHLNKTLEPEEDYDNYEE